MKPIEKKPFSISLFLYLIISIFVIQLPLFNYLGYEFSAAVALFVPWICGYFTIAILRIRFPQNEQVSPIAFNRAIRDSILWGAALLVLPFFLASANVIFIKNCSYFEGAFFFILIPLTTTIWSVGLSALCFVLFRHSRMMYIFFLILVLLHPLYIGYFSPQIYSYNFVYGYFPGLSYDQVLSITQTLLLFRLATVLMAIWFLLVARFVVLRDVRQNIFKKIRNLSKIFLPNSLNVKIMTISVILAIVWLVRAPLGFETSIRQIQSKLSSHIKTEHFQIYYSPHSFSNNEIRWVAAVHEFYFHQITSALQTEFSGEITSFIYPDDDTKRDLIGTSTTNIAKPWLRQIHLNSGSWEGTLKHELVHVIVGKFGMPIINAHYNIGIVEGLAMAVDEDFGNRTLHDYSAAIMKFHLVEDPSQLIQPLQFMTHSSSMSYVLMGSFCKFLIDKYSIGNFKDLYHGENETKVYGKSYDKLNAEWLKFLEQVEVPESWRKHVNFYFNRPSIFAKECARTVARLNDEADRSLVRNDAQSAMQKFSDALTTSWNTESYAGLIRASYKAAWYDSVVSLVKRQLSDSTHSFSFMNLFLIYGDALWYKNDLISASRVYEEIYLLDLSDRFNELSSLRLTAMNDIPLRPFMVNYLTGVVNDSTALFCLDSLQRNSVHPIANYIKAKILFHQHDYIRAIKELESISEKFEFSTLNAGRQNLLGQAYFRMKDFQQARVHFLESINFLSNPVSTQKVGEWLEKCAWFEKNAGSYIN